MLQMKRKANEGIQWLARLSEVKRQTQTQIYPHRRKEKAAGSSSGRWKCLAFVNTAPAYVAYV